MHNTCLELSSAYLTGLRCVSDDPILDVPVCVVAGVCVLALDLVIDAPGSWVYRKRMRAQGMRPIQIWVADVRSPGFAAEAHRQAAAVAASKHATDDQAFIDALSFDDK